MLYAPDTLSRTNQNIHEQALQYNWTKARNSVVCLTSLLFPSDNNSSGSTQTILSSLNINLTKKLTLIGLWWLRIWSSYEFNRFFITLFTKKVNKATVIFHKHNTWGFNKPTQRDLKVRICVGFTTPVLPYVLLYCLLRFSQFLY